MGAGAEDGRALTPNRGSRRREPRNGGELYILYTCHAALAADHADGEVGADAPALSRQRMKSLATRLIVPVSWIWRSATPSPLTSPETIVLPPDAW